MNSYSCRLGNLLRSSLVGLGIAMTTACANNDLLQWTEEVKLSDGRIIQLQRRLELTASGFPVQRRGLYKYHEFCYAPMGVHWKSRGGYVPDIFDIANGKAYVHVPISDCSQCMLHGYPETDALYFVWDHGKWKRIAHEEFPASFEWNLLRDPIAAPGHEKDDVRGFLSLNEKLTKHDHSLRFEQKRKGWKRVSEQEGGPRQCNACRKRGVSTTESAEIFVQADSTNCR